jgi:hypothetical protein
MRTKEQIEKLTIQASKELTVLKLQAQKLAVLLHQKEGEIIGYQNTLREEPTPIKAAKEKKK